MDWSKLDANLHAALDDEDATRPLRVFLECAHGARPEALDPAWGTTRLGVHTYTAALDRDGLEWLSDRPWVRRISLSTTMRPTTSGVSTGEDEPLPATPSTRMRMPGPPS